MPQVRVMHQDADHVARVVELLLALIRDHGQGVLFAGDPTDLGTRGPSARVVFDLSDVRGRPTAPTASAAPDAEVYVERVTVRPNRRPRDHRPPALPPGRAAIEGTDT